jgi:hypothetical protein
LKIKHKISLCYVIAFVTPLFADCRRGTLAHGQRF